MRGLLSCLFALSLMPGMASADDWPEYRGPRRDDVSHEKGLLAEWPDGGPPLAWTYSEAGVGYSGVAVVGDRLYTIGARGETEHLIALDLKPAEGDVREAWSAAVGPTFQFKGNNWSAGPSSTPTIAEGLVYALGGNGHLLCVEAATGNEVWRKDLPQELAAEVNPIGGGPKKLGWGFTWSPLVDGDRLIGLPGGPGGTMAALDRKSGALLWRTTDVTDQAAYTSPMAGVLRGVPQYVALTNRSIFGVDAKDGRVLWNYRRMPPFSTEVVNSPIVHNDHVYVTVGAGQGCELIRIDRDDASGAFKAESVYSTKNMANHHGNVVLVGDHVYGFSERRGWQCQNLMSGEIAWSERQKLRAGSLTCADGRFYCYGEDDGTAALIDVSAEGWKERGRFRIPRQTTLRKPSGRIWTPPVVANGRLYLRDQELLFCYDVTAKK